MKIRLKGIVSSNIPSQALNSASSFVIVILLSFVLTPSEFGVFSFFWAVFLVGLSLIRACVADVLINQPSDSKDWKHGALGTVISCSFVISALLSVGCYFFVHNLEGSGLVGAAIFFAALQDFARFYALKTGVASKLLIAESIGFIFSCLVPFLAIVQPSANANTALLALFLCSLCSFVIFSYCLWEPGVSHFRKGWISSHRAGLTSFLIDAIIGATFNLWLATQIVNYLNYEDLGIYRSLTTYFGVASLLANYAKSGFTARFNQNSRPKRMLWQLGAAMVIAPALQATVLLASQRYFQYFGALSLGGPLVILVAMTARIFATLSTLTVVALRSDSGNYWTLTLTRMLSLVPGALLTICVLHVLGINGAFLIDLLNYSLMATLPLIWKGKRRHHE